MTELHELDATAQARRSVGGGLVGRARAAPPRPHRRPRRGARRVHHGHRRAGARAGSRGGPAARRGRRAPVRRCADGVQGPDLHRRRAHHDGLGRHAGLRAARQRLRRGPRRAAGFISLGKTNTPEFGLSSYTDNDVVGPARTPWDPTRNAGGSSGGAAAAVAAGWSRGPGQRRRRLDPHTGELLRHLRVQAEPRPGQRRAGRAATGAASPATAP